MAINEQNMKEYYSHVYPVEDIADWLSYSRCHTSGESASYLTRREFCFTLLGDIFTRHRSYSTVESLRNELVSKFPEKIDVGAVYNVAPDLKRAQAIAPQERELVFDIDMSDYDAVRSCCKGKKICQFCWPWMSTAAQCLRKICSEDFGFKYILPVFSGRRGIHLWVCDRKARRMTDEERAACVGYMTVLEGENKTSLTYDLLRKEGLIHPTFDEILSQILRPAFARIFLGGEENPNSIMFHHGPASIVHGCLTTIVGGSSFLPPQARDALGKLQPADGAGINWAEVERRLPPGVIAAMQFALLYPRLDEHVSTRRDHLLKLPFCVHPGTGRLCTPLMWDTLDTFHPLEDPPAMDELLMTRAIEMKWKRPLINMVQDMADDAEELSAERALQRSDEPAPR